MNSSVSDNLAGKLNQRITLQQKVLTPDGGAGNSVVWQDVATIWAEIMPQRSSELFARDKLELKNTYSITIRYRGDITGDKRFVLGSRVFGITGVMNFLDRSQTLEIMAVEEI